MKKILRPRPSLLVNLFLLLSTGLFAQTSWRGTTSTSWATASNWSNGVPTSTVDAIIGDANFTGSSQPSITATAVCKSLTLGGTVASTLSVNKNLTISGNLTINANGTIQHGRATITLSGNWSNSGAYAGNSAKSTVVFSGTTQSLGGSTVTSFRKLTINAGSIVTLNQNVTVYGTGNANILTVNGTLNPNESPTYQVTGSGSDLTVASGGVLKVNASTFVGNYAQTGAFTFSAGSTVEYSATAVNQTISNAYTYSTLSISGSLTKTLGGSLPALNSTTSATGNITVSSGTLDLSTFTANRGTSVAGGTLSISNGATLKIGGTNTLPANYTTNTFGFSSTVQYSGTDQTVSAQTYGHLTFVSSSGAVTKTMPATAFTIAGNFTSSIGAGTSVAYTAASIITFGGSVNIGTGTTFNSSTFSHTVAGNWVNNGTFTGSTGTINMTGTSTTLSGTGTHNFNNLIISGSNVSATSASLSVSGDLSTSGVGSFTHSAGSTLTMSGTTKTISGTGITLSNLTVSGSATTASAIIITGNITVNAGAGFTGTAGSVTMSGASKTISSSGTLSFYNLTVTGSVTTASNFTISSVIDVSGSFTASAGIATFTGTSILNGTANLFGVTLNGTSLQLSTNAVLGIAGTYTITAGTLNVTSTTPNTVNFNGSSARTVAAGTFHHLIFTGNTNTAGGAITVNGDLTISASTTFAASTYTHIIKGNWVNNGTFTAGTSTVQFTGAADGNITGATTFNIITVNKTSSTNVVNLQNNVSVATLNMTLGGLITGTSTLTITTTRTGAGIILGNIQRTHTFTTGVAYEFEGQYNTITFASLSGVTSVLVKVTLGSIADFPSGGSINRLYDITVPAGTYTATLRLHYEDAELNGNAESSMNLWRYNNPWASAGKSSNNTTTNYIELTGITNIATRWTCSDDNNIVRWNGSVSTDWATATNWTTVQGTPSKPPSSNDIVEIGFVSFTNAPVINTAATAKTISFGSAQATTLTLTTGGSLVTQGNISGTWTANATHTINVNGQTLTVNGDVVLSDGTTSHVINMNISTGTANVTGSITQSGGANIIFSGAGALNIGNNYSYTSGTFTGSTGTVTYNGTASQVVAGVNYNNLTINKATGIASISSATTISGNLTNTAGQLDLTAGTTITGNVTIASGAILTGGSINISVAGNWSNSGTFTPSSGIVIFNGSSAQTISASPFNNISINKAVGTATLSGNLSITGNLSILAGTADLSTFTANRSSLGGTLTLSDGASLLIGGANNFPSNYGTYSLGAASTVTYNGTIAQTTAGITYGHLVFSNGGSNVKTLAASTTISGNITINSGATFSASSYTINLSGNWTNSGTFTASTSTVNLNGAGKTITGNTTFNKLSVYGSYTVAGTDYTTNGLLLIATGGTLTGGAGTGTITSDLTNNGTFTSTGTTTFTGTVAQAIQLSASIAPNLNIVNFNGTVSPVMSSTSSPTFATLNINNTGGVTSGISWTVSSAFNVSTGASFNGSSATHYINGSFTNNGTVSSSGTLNFAPTAAQTIQLNGTSFTSTGTIIFGGTAAITVTGVPNTLTNITIANTTGVTPSANWTMGGNFSINNGSIFNAGSYSYSVAGNIVSNGTLNGGTSTFTMSGAAGQLSGNATTTFYHFITTGTTITANSDFNVSGNLTTTGTLDASIGTVNFTGSVNATISGATTPLAQFNVAKTSGAIVTLARNITVASAIDIVSGTLDASTYTITQDGTAGAINSLFIRNNAALKIAGTNPLPAFTTYTLDSLSTVEYAGTTQTVTSISALSPYGNIVISTSGTKTANGSLNIRNNFTLTNGTFVAGSYIDTLGGNWSMTSGAFTNTGSTVTLNGGAAQDINSTGAFNNLTINKPAANAILSANATVNGILTFTLGKIQTGIFSLIVPAGGSVTGTAQSTGWVYGKLQKNFATGANVSRTMEVGTATAYTPAVVNIVSVGTAGNLTAEATAADHPNIATSGINANKSVNRYWSFTNSGIVFTNASITVNWLAADVDAGATTANFKVGNYSASSWTLPTTVSPLATSIQATGVTAFGDIAVGELITAYSWTGTLNTNWSTAANWSSLAVPNASTNVTIPTGVSNYPILSASTVQINNLTVQTGASLTISGVTLQISGTISNSGTFNVGNGTIELNGTVAQTIPANAFAANTVKNLIISNDITLAGQDTLTGVLSFGNVNGKTFTTGGFLTLKSNAAGTARVADITNAGANSGNSISGNVTMERWIKLRAGGTGRAYRLLAPTVNTTGSIKANWMEGGMNTVIGTNINPLSLYGTQITGSGGNTNGFDVTQSNAASLYAIANAVTPTYTAIGSTGGTLNALTGYFLYIRGDRSMNMTIPLAANMPTSSTTLRTTGTIVQGTQTAFTNAYIGGGALNLVTNPYPSPIDWSLVKGASTGITNFYTFWDPNFGTRGGFITVSTAGVASSGLATQFIQPGQAFFVESDGVGTPAVSIQESHKTAGNNNDVFLTPPPPVEAFRTELYFTEPNAYRRVIDGAIVLFDNAYSAAVDNDDAKEINNWDENIAIDRGGKHLSIEGRPVIISKDTIPLFMNNMKQQAYEFEFTPAVFSNPNLKAELIDNFLNTRTLLSVAVPTVVSFTVTADAASKATDRFKVVFGSFSGPLAIDVLTIKAQAKNNGVQVDWQSKTETDMAGYELERAIFGNNFTKLNTTTALGNSTIPVSYNWFDANPNTGTNFYRVKAIDKAGNIKYSDIVKVTFGKGEPGIVVYPNPLPGRIFKIDMNNLAKGIYLLNLYNNMGQQVYTAQLQHDGSQATKIIDLKEEIAKGVYQLQLSSDNGFKTTQRIIKN